MIPRGFQVPRCQVPREYQANGKGNMFGGYPEVGTIHGASGICMRCIRRYGYVWLVVSDGVFTAGRAHLQVDKPA